MAVACEVFRLFIFCCTFAGAEALLSAMCKRKHKKIYEEAFLNRFIFALYTVNAWFK